VQQREWKINMNKTEIIVFRNAGPLRISERWYFRGKLVNTTSVYKYLGLLFTPTLSWTEAHKKSVSSSEVYHQSKALQFVHTLVRNCALWCVFIALWFCWWCFLYFDLGLRPYAVTFGFLTSNLLIVHWIRIYS